MKNITIAPNSEERKVLWNALALYVITIAQESSIKDEDGFHIEFEDADTEKSFRIAMGLMDKL